MVNIPTKGTNIFDIFATNRPSLIPKCDIVPGISDREAVYVEAQLKILHTPPTPRQILLWNKADFVYINDWMSHNSALFLDRYTSDTPVQELWAAFKK